MTCYIENGTGQKIIIESVKMVMRLSACGWKKMNCRIASLYICVQDMERAVRFYEDFFGQPITEKDSVYSVFDINGFRFGLFAYKNMNEEHVFGSNCLPSVGFPDLHTLKAKLEGKEICFPLTMIKGNWVAEFVDSEGNHIEITAPV